MANKIWGSNNEPLKIQFITDTHYYSRKNGTEGKAYEKDESKSQMVVKDSDLVLKRAFDMLCEDTSTDIVVLSGDTTRNGEITSHDEFIEMLRDLKKRGKRVYVITATHDFRGGGVSKGFVGDEQIEVPAIENRHDLWDMYYEFGPNEAISTFPQSLCYCVQLAPGYRMLALNDDTNDKEEGRGSGYSDECKKWILEQIEDAKKNDQFIFAMTHHPMISPSPFYSIIGKGDMQRDHEETRELFADAGLQVMLTGHTHVHNIGYVTTEKGNRFYDIASGAVIGCPPVMRNVIFDPKNKKVDVDTIYVDNVDGLDTKGKSFPDYMKGFFFGMIAKVIWAMGNDIDELAYMTPAFSIPGEKVKKLGWIIKPIGKWLNKLTFKKIWKLCKKESGLKKADIADIADNKVTDFILELVQNLYCGDSPYTPDTREYKLTCGLLNIIDSFLDTIHLSIGKILKGATSVRGLVEPLLWKNCEFKDEEAVLPLYPLFDDENPAPDSMFTERSFSDPVRKSKKGPLVLAIIILIVILLLAIVAGIIALIVWAVIAIIHAIGAAGAIGLLF